MTIDWCKSGLSRQQTSNSYLAWMVVVATIPLVIVGFLGKDFIEDNLRSATVIAISTIVFGLALGYAAWAAKRGLLTKDEYSIIVITAILIGCAQTLALIPGTSRSGITMTAAVLLGLNLQASARFSFLLSIPAILAAGMLLIIELLGEGQSVAWSDLVLGTVLAFLSAWLCIHWFLKLLDKIGFMPFVIYRLLLGGLLLWWFV